MALVFSVLAHGAAFALVAWSAGPWRLPAPIESAILVTLLREAAGEAAPLAAPPSATREAKPAAAPPLEPPKRTVANPPPAARTSSGREPRPHPTPALEPRTSTPAPTAAEPAPAEGAAGGAPSVTESASGAPAGAAASSAGPGDADRVYGEGEVDSAAAPLGGIRRPEYPARERMMGREGRVSLRVTVDAGGAVREVAVASSAGAALDAAARHAVERTRFRPARREGRAVASTVTVNVAFELD